MLNIKFLWLVFFISLNNCYAESRVLTDNIELIGNPYKMKYVSLEDTYSRNVWDLQNYNGRLFIGAGNSSNQGPSQNSGPLPLISYVPEKDKFINEGIIYDDQIDLFTILNQQLYIPGHDATGNWKWGNFYTKDKDGKLQMHRNIPAGLHLYDMALIKGKLYSAIGLNEGAAVGMTTNRGKSWEISKLGRSRVYAFMQIGNTLFATKKFKRTSKPYFSVAQLMRSGEFSARYDLSLYKMFPDTKFEQTYSRLIRSINLGNSSIYVGAYKYNDHQSKPFGLYQAYLKGSKLDIKKINLGRQVIARDIIKRADTLYVLATLKTKKQVINMVFRGDKHKINAWKDISWEKIISFNYPSFARSFEELDGDFYFGIGSDLEEPKKWKKSEMLKQTGDIIRIKKVYFSKKH